MKNFIILSEPYSGNTLLRYLIEHCFNIRTYGYNSRIDLVPIRYAIEGYRNYDYDWVGCKRHGEVNGFTDEPLIYIEREKKESRNIFDEWKGKKILIKYEDILTNHNQVCFQISQLLEKKFNILYDYEHHKQICKDYYMKNERLASLVDTYILTPSDINEHLQMLMDLAKGHDVIEFGARGGVSTAALLYSAKSFTSYDIEPRQLDHLLKLGLNFIQADDLEIPQVECDVLFIDTHHSYQQLWEELKRHAEGVKKYIVMHDTVTFGYHDQDLPEGKTSQLPLTETKKHGLVAAIHDFLHNTIDGESWKIEKIYENNNGLTVIRRVK